MSESDLFTRAYDGPGGPSKQSRGFPEAAENKNTSPAADAEAGRQLLTPHDWHRAVEHAAEMIADHLTPSRWEYLAAMRLFDPQGYENDVVRIPHYS